MISCLSKEKIESPQIAFSGGADSIAVSFYLRGKNPLLKHFNHKFCKEDDEIEEKCRTFAKKFDFNIQVERSKEKYEKGSSEDWCRKQRYDWFKELGGTLITCHNLSEATESYLMNCFAGHPEYLPIPLETVFGKTKVIRPFILNTKEEINFFIKKNNLTQFVAEDPLNFDLTRRRNWVRMSLLPEIKLRTNVEKVVKKRYLDKIKSK
jgi:tRNA(Ile)-lysidine synthetase-like protein